MLTEFQKRKLVKLFSMYDTTHNGRLAHQDFEKITKRIIDLRNWSKRSPRCQILIHKYEYKWKRLIEKADKAHNQEISLDEWFNYHDAILNNQTLYQEEVQSLMEIVVEALDDDEDGKLTQQDWGKLLSVYSISPVYAASVFSKLDTDQNGFLTNAEVLQMIFDFYHSDQPEVPANSMFGPY